MGSYRYVSIAVVAVFCAGTSLAQRRAADGDLSLSAIFSSGAYEYGLSQTNGGAAVRFAVDYQHARGLFAGGYVTNVDYAAESAWQRPRELKINAYAGFRMRGPEWTTHVALSRYRYPGLAIDYDYTQISVGAAYRDRYFATIAHARDWFGFGYSGTTVEVGLARPLPRDMELGVNAGRVDVGAYPGGPFTHWNLGVSKLIDRFALDLRYYSSSTDYVTWLGDPEGTRVAVSVAYAIAPRSP